MICDTALGLFDENGRQHRRVPAYLHEGWGIRESESFWVAGDGRPTTIWERMGPLGVPAGACAAPPDPVSSAPDLEITDPVRGVLRGRVYITPLELQAPAEAIGFYRGQPVAARSVVGAGAVYYFGTNLGAAIHEGDETALRVVETLIRRHTTPPISGARLRPRLMAGEGEALLVVINEQDERVCERLALPADYRQARDIEQDSWLDVDGNAIEVDVDAFDVRVIHLRG